MRSKETSNLIIGIVTILLFCIALYFILKYFLSFFSAINTQTLTTLLTVTIPLIASITTVYLGRYFEKQKTIQEKLREKKIPVYNEFIGKTISYILEKNKDKGTKELGAFFQKITPEMIVWADDKVLKAWADFRATAINNVDSVLLAKQYEDVLLAMRKDLGHDNKALNNFTLLRCFLNDMDSALTKQKEK